jgi:AraC family transcriptional regulator, positive regulator of tynA and feaB
MVLSISEEEKNNSGQHLDYETWRASVRAISGRFNAEGVEPSAFTGWLRATNVYGFTAAEIGSNAPQVERTYTDVRLDRADHYFTIFQVTGQSVMTVNDRAVRLDVGDVALIDLTRPVTFCSLSEGGLRNSVSLYLPRKPLICHLGFEPRDGLYRRSGTAAGRLLFDLIRNPGSAELACSPADRYMQLVVYDLVGALFAPSDAAPSRHAEKLFQRILDVIRDGFADPDLGPCGVAAKAGISLRYLQKLLTQRGLTCSELIYSTRLDHAARLLDRRSTVGMGQPLSEIAYACGFRDYTHFGRKFRIRFGRAPSAHSADDGHADDEAAHASTDQDAQSPRGVGHSASRSPSETGR